ncbi:MAG: UvrD-helicase domain-containing protein [Clostridiales bacterium]|jgi:ATP-dependent helicase/nuclease subunit A|nr:UvrD-helicase domain-containing protein [Clostridiales bacterium]
MPKGFKPTPAQEKVIRSSATPLLVSASAGSGKTTTMVERVATMLTASFDGGEPLGIDSFLINTFTEKAAADIRAKLIVRLSEAATQSAGDKRAYFSAQAALAAAAEIGTLHSFCLTLVRAYFFAAEVPKDFVIDAGAGQTARLHRVLDETIAKYLDKPAFFQLYDMLCTGRDTRRLKETVLKIHDYLQAGGTFGSGGFDHTAYLNAARKSVAAGFLPGLQRVLAAFPVDAVPAMGVHYDFCTEALAYLAGDRAEVPEKPKAIAKNGKDQKAADAYACLKAEVLYPLCLMPSSALEVWKDIDALPDTAEGATQIGDGLIALASDFSAAYAAEKRAAGALDYNDLEQCALKILSDAALLSEIRARYPIVFTDEYQDTNPTQERILTLLSDGKMFMVGDAKQSIYAFRQCDPGIFLRKHDDYARTDPDALVRLNANFRSHKNILAFTNTVFSGLMTKELGGIDYAAEAMLQRDDDTENGAEVRIVLATKPEKKKSTLPPVYSPLAAAADDGEDDGDENGGFTAEAALIAAEIGRILATPNPKKARLTPLDNLYLPSDIVILVRSTAGYAAPLAAALAAYNIRAAATGGNLLEGRGALRLLALLQLADNRLQDVPLVTALTAPFVALSPNDLADVRKRYADVPFCEAAGLYAAAHDDETARKLRDFYQKLDEAAACAQYLLPGELTARIMSLFDTETAVLLHEEDGREQQADMRAFCAYANASAETSLSAFVRTAARQESVEAPSAAGADCVRIMTVHASKGLEFPCVILARLHHGFNLTDLNSNILLHRDTGLVSALFFESTRTHAKSKAFAAARMVMRHGLLEENLRILYVALTRAEHRLVLTGVNPAREIPRAHPYVFARAGSYLKLLLPQLEREGAHAACDFSLTVQAADAPTETAQTAAAGDDIPLIGKPDTAALARLRARWDYRVPAYGDVAEKVTVTKLAAEGADAEDVPAHASRYPVDADRDPRSQGLAYHKAFELVPFDRRAPADVAKALAGYTAAGRMTKEQLGLVDAGLIAAMLQKNAIFTAAAGDGARVFREQPLLIPLPAGTLLQGIIDLLLVEADGLTVLDYKLTAQTDPAVLQEKYGAQVGLYAEAAEKLLGKPIKRKLIASIFAAAVVEIGTENAHV